MIVLWPKCSIYSRTMNIYKSHRVLIIVLLAFLLASCAKKDDSIGLAVEFTTHSACAHVAKKKGWFEEEGIKLKFYNSYITGMALSSAFARGDIDVAYICLVPAINTYANAKVPLKVISGVHKYGYCLAVNGEKVRSIKDIENKDIRVGCTREGSPTAMLLHEIISKYGLNKKVLMGKVLRMPPPKLLIALKMGRLDAAVMPEQFPSIAEEAGFKVLVKAEDVWPEMQGSVVIAKDKFIKEHPEMVKKIISVTQRATDFINEHPLEASKIIAEELDIASRKVFPEKMIDLSKNIIIRDSAIYQSLTKRLKNSTFIDAAQIQVVVDKAYDLKYIRDGFSAEEIIYKEK